MHIISTNVSAKHIIKHIRYKLNEQHGDRRPACYQTVNAIFRTS